MKRAATHLFERQSKNRVFFFSNFHFDLRPPGRNLEQDGGAKTRPQGQLECANPRGSSGGMARLGTVTCTCTWQDQGGEGRGKQRALQR